MKPPVIRRTVLVVVALATLAGVVTGREKPALELVEVKAPRAAASSADAGIDLDKLSRREAMAPHSDPFARRSFAAPAPQAAAPAPEAPAVPPLPFAYFGKVIENGKTEVYVMKGDELLAIAPGHKIGDYRVDAISDATIRFTYLPLKAQQSMDLPPANG